MRNKHRLLFMLVYCCLVAGITRAQTKKLYTGVTAGWQSSSFKFVRDGTVLPNNGAWRGALILDYEITSRLSFQSQIGVQKINALTLFSDESYSLTYPELWLGLTEYLPVGAGSFFVNGSLHGGYGFASSLNNGKSVFDEDGYHRFRSGFAFTLGYVLRNGLFINTGIQSASFSPFYRSPNGSKAFDFSFHAISLGYMFDHKKRNQVRKHF